MVVLFVVGIAWGIATQRTAGPGQHFDLGLVLLLGYLLAGLPWGWSTLTRITPAMFLTLSIIGWVIYFAVKFTLALFVGAFITPFKIYQVISGFRRAREMEAHIQGSVSSRGVNSVS